jgi:succinate-semialdehyde dehydrogenase/glutarate-semialdehyde dehydrogenase
LTVLGDIPDTARAMNEEPFGPLALLSRVKSVDEAVRKANSLPYGLAAYAFTESAATAESIARSIECGNLAINHFTASFAETPFGGVKDSGYGREGGVEGLDGYTVTKLVSHKMSA